MRLNPAASGGFFVALMLTGATHADSLVSGLPTTTTSPIPSGSCIYVDQGGTTDTKACGAAGAYWSSLFGLALSTRSIGTSGLLTGGGDLSADRTITLGNIPANTLIGNPTGSTAAPTTIVLPNDCSASDETLRYSEGVGFACGTIAGGGGGSPGGTAGAIQYNNGGAFGGAVITGIVKGNGTSAPAAAVAGTDYLAPGGALGTPSSGTLTNATGLPIATGISGLGTGVATFLATPSSANLAAAVTGETGSGALVFGTSPALTTPDLGTPSAVNLTNATSIPAGQLTGNVAVARLNGGTGASASTFWRGDGTWATPAGGGGSIDVGDGTTTVSPTDTITVGTGLKVTDAGGGEAQIDLVTVVNSQSGASYTVVAGDATKTVRMTNASPTTLNLTAAATLGANFGFYAECDAGCTIDPNSSETIDGASTLVLTAGGKAWVSTDGTSWRGGVLPAKDPLNASSMASGTLAVARGGTGIASGTSGGVLAYTASGTLASSGALTANLPVIGGGAGAAPTVGTRTGNTTEFATWTGSKTTGRCVELDGSGNLQQSSAACGAGGGTGDVTGPASSTDSNIALFDGTTGKAIKDGGKGIPSGAIVGTSDTQTLTNKTINGANNTLTVRLNADVTGNLPVANLNGGTGASSSTFWRGDGTWAAPSGGGSGALTLVGTVTADNTSGIIAFTGLTGQNYRLECSNLVPATVNQNPGIQFSNSGVFATTGYEWGLYGYTLATTPSVFTVGNLSDTHIRPRIANGTMNNSGGLTMIVDVFKLASSEPHRVMGRSFALSSTPTWSDSTFFGNFTGNTNPIDGIRVTISSGNWTSGTCSLYEKAT